MRGERKMVLWGEGGVLMATVLMALCSGVAGVSITKFRLSRPFAIVGEHIEFECSYSLLAGERGHELLLRRGGRVLKHLTFQPGQPQNMTDTVVFSREISSVRHADEYTCTMRTTDGRNADGKVYLHVISVAEGEFESSWRRENCSSIVFSQSTPFIYPSIQAFCGVWMSISEFPSAMGRNVPPKQVLDLQDPGYWLRCAEDCSFPSAAGKWTAIEMDNATRRIPERLEILDATVYLDSLPSNTKTSIKCIYWAQAKNNDYITINRSEFVIDEKFEHRCEELKTPDVASNVVISATEYDTDFCTSDWEANTPIKVEASCRHDRTQNFTISCLDAHWRMDGLTKDGSLLQQGEENATLERWNTIVERLNSICPADKKTPSTEKPDSIIPDDVHASRQHGNAIKDPEINANSDLIKEPEMVNDASPSHQTAANERVLTARTAANERVSTKQHPARDKKPADSAGSFVNISSYSSLLLLFYSWNYFMH